MPREVGPLLMRKMAASFEVWGHLTGVIDTKEKFLAERKHMAGLVWAEYKDNDSRACRGCHAFSRDVLAKQQEMARDVHAPVLEGKATCIDCHKGVGHSAP